MATQSGYFSQIDSNNIKGGLYSVSTYFDLLSLNAATHFKDGMLCYITKQDAYYQYNARKQKWLEVNIERVPVINDTIVIGGETYNISKMDNFNDLLQQLIRLKYSDSASKNLAINMRAYPELYQAEEDEYQAWVTLCKIAAYEYFNGSGSYDITNREGDINNKFDYPILKNILSKMQDNIEYLYVASFPLNVSVGINEGAQKPSINFENINDSLYIEYNRLLSDMSLHMNITNKRGNNIVDLIGYKITDDNGNILYNVTYDKENPQKLDTTDILYKLPNANQGNYNIAIEAVDSIYAEPTVYNKNIVISNPYYYGSSKFADIRTAYNQITETYTSERILPVICKLMANNGFDTIKEVYTDNDITVPINENDITLPKLNNFITNVLSANYNLEFAVFTEDEYYTIKNNTVLSFLNMIAQLVITVYNNKIQNEQNSTGMSLNSLGLTTLEGTLGGTKYLAPQDNIVINNQDGNYIWICIPSIQYTGNYPVITCNNQEFPLDPQIFEITENNVSYKCFRSDGDNGIEACTLVMHIEYNIPQ